MNPSFESDINSLDDNRFEQHYLARSNRRMNELKTIMEHSSESQSVVDLNEPIDIDVNSMKAIYTSSPINPGEKIVRGVIEESSKINSTFVIEENMLDSIAVDASHEVINDPPYKSFLTSTPKFSIPDNGVVASKRSVLRELLTKFNDKLENEDPTPPKFPSNTVVTRVPSRFGSITTKPVALPVKIPPHMQVVNKTESTPKSNLPNPNANQPNSVKALRNRWEVSSATGTPMDPDNGSEELLHAAARLAIPAKPVIKRNFVANKLTFNEIVGRESEKVNKPIRENEPKSPAPKSPRFGEVHYFGKDDKDASIIVEEEMLEAEPEATEVDPETDGSDRPESSSSDIIMNHWLKPSERSPTKTITPQKCIDEAFHFIEDQADDSGMTVSHKSMSPEKPITTPRSFYDNADTPSLLNDITKDLEHYQPTTPKSVRSAGDAFKSSPPGSALAHTISFYRRQKSAQRGDGRENKGQLHLSNSSASVNHRSVSIEADENFEEKMRQIEEAIKIQQNQIAQLSHALSYCRQNVMFHGGVEEVDAQRVLLVATERRRALIFERDRLQNIKSVQTLGPLGTITIGNLAVRLSPDYLHAYAHQNENSRPSLYYFILLIKHREQVSHTQLVTSRDGLKKGVLEFPNYIQLHNLPPDFTCSIEVFCLKINPQIGTGTNKAKKSSTWKKMLASPYKQSHNFTPLRFQNTSTDSGFQKAGHALINRAHVKNRVKTFKLCDAMHPVEGTLQLSLKCCAETYGAIAHRGFLSLYQTVDNMGSWTRFWCALFEGCMRFWRYPEDEDTKKPLVTLRMDDFISEIKAVPPTVASFQFSMEGHIRILKDKNSFEDIKLLLAADVKESMDEWLEAMNESIVDATTWTTVYPDLE